MTTDLMTFLLRKQKIHEAYQKRKEEGQRVITRLQEALKGTRLAGGGLFKIRKVVVLCDKVLEVRKGRDAAIQNTKIDAVVKLVEKFNKRLEKYSTVISSTRKEENLLTLTPSFSRTVDTRTFKLILSCRRDIVLANQKVRSRNGLSEQAVVSNSPTLGRTVP
jgi:hypothetical protein